MPQLASQGAQSDEALVNLVRVRAGVRIWVRVGPSPNHNAKPHPNPQPNPHPHPHPHTHTHLADGRAVGEATLARLQRQHAIGVGDAALERVAEGVGGRATRAVAVAGARARGTTGLN